MSNLYRRHLCWLALPLVLAAVLFVIPTESRGAAAEADSPVASALSPAGAPVANINYYKNQVLNFLFNTFRSRERLIQLTLVGVTIGLFVMLRKMPGKS